LHITIGAFTPKIKGKRKLELHTGGAPSGRPYGTHINPTRIPMSEPKEDTWLIELPDDETRIVTTTQLLEMEKTAEEFDGFYGWRVVKKMNP
jgi:hypothetical protein